MGPFNVPLNQQRYNFYCHRWPFRHRQNLPGTSPGQRVRV